MLLCGYPVTNELFITEHPSQLHIMATSPHSVARSKHSSVLDEGVLKCEQHMFPYDEPQHMERNANMRESEDAR